MLYSVFKFLFNVLSAFLSRKNAFILQFGLVLFSFGFLRYYKSKQPYSALLNNNFFLDVVDWNIQFLHLSLPSMILRFYSLALTFGEHFRVQGLSKNRNWSFLYMCFFSWTYVVFLLDNSCRKIALKGTEFKKKKKKGTEFI